jgi:hypothetical protein
MIDISVHLSYGEVKLQAGGPRQKLFKFSWAFDNCSPHLAGAR